MEVCLIYKWPRPLLSFFPASVPLFLETNISHEGYHPPFPFTIWRHFPPDYVRFAVDLVSGQDEDDPRSSLPSTASAVAPSPLPLAPRTFKMHEQSSAATHGAATATTTARRKQGTRPNGAGCPFLFLLHFSSSLCRRPIKSALHPWQIGGCSLGWSPVALSFPPFLPSLSTGLG